MRVTPLHEEIEVLERRADGAVLTRYPVLPEEPLLRGHYPGFPILPGVCLIEIACLSALAANPGLTLAGIRSTRFLNPAFPGDEVTCLVQGDGVKFTASLSVGDRQVAKVSFECQDFECQEKEEA